MSETRNMTPEEHDGEKGGLLQEAKDTAGRAREQMKTKASAAIDTGREKTADAAEGMADAIRRSAGRIKDGGPLPMIAERAADGIERMGRYLEEHDVRDLLGEVERFARREPAIFLGAAFAIGLVGGRFLKSSARRSEEEEAGEEEEEVFEEEEILAAPNVEIGSEPKPPRRRRTRRGRGTPYRADEIRGERVR